jgi:4-diphosphocytidyl-2-C-methyl-D-erythritol kinase
MLRESSFTRHAVDSPAVTIDAPAKINLALHVVGRRDDGYHNIETLAVFTRFGDRLSISDADADGFSVAGQFAAATPADDTNLVLKARDLLRDAAGNACPPVSMELNKNLPVASGIGGGSSDAAAALRGLRQFWNLDIADAELARIGQEIGADVPMCLAARPLIAAETGTDLTMLAEWPPLGLVLVNPGVAVSTKDVFAGLAKRDNDAMPPPPRQIDFHSLRNWLEATRNDLQNTATALQPVIGAALAELRRADAGFARMSGSGATCFGLFETGNVAKRAAAAIRARHPDWFVAATRTIASGA